MEVIWMEQAEDALSHAANLVKMDFGEESARKLLREVYRTGCLLGSNPNLGRIEPLLSHLKTTYRSIVVNSLNKIVYRIVDNRIEIADFWDTRREPKNQATQVKE